MAATVVGSVLAATLVGHEAFVGFISLSLPSGGLLLEETETEIVMTVPDGELVGGRLNAALANEIGKLVADFTGRGATKSRAFLHQDMVVCLLEDGATKAEVNLVAAGRSELVRLQRDAIQRAMEQLLVGAVEGLTGRTVRTFLSGTSTPGADSVEVFVLEPIAGE
jgi:uncharacterized protein YbcI